MNKEKKYIEFYLGYSCNLNCDYCDIDKSNSHVNNINELFEILHKDRSIEGIIISGGEPTLYRNQVIEILNTCKTYEIIIVSNGTHVEILKEFYYVNPSKVKIVVSYDGHKNDRHFDSFDVMVDLYQDGILDSISMVIYNSNYSNLFEYINEISETMPGIILKNKLILDFARVNDNLYKMDLEILKKQLKKVISLIPENSFFSSKSECLEFNKSVNEVFYMHSGDYFNDGCSKRYDNSRELYDSYKIKCKDDCPNNECRGKSCPVISTILQKDIPSSEEVNFCKLNSILHEVKTEYLLEKEWEARKEKFTELELILTTGCNLRCKYCFQNHEIHNNYKVMDYSIVDKAFDEFVSTGKIHDLLLFGGEPILPSTYNIRKYIVEKIKASKHKVRMVLSSNGFHLDDKEIDLLKDIIDNKIGIYYQFSIDSIKEAHDVNRIDFSGNGTFNRIIENLKKVSEIIGSENVGINSVLSIDSIQFLPEWGEYLTKNIINKYANSISFRFDQYRQFSLNRKERDILINNFKRVLEFYNNGNISAKVTRTIFNLGNYNNYSKNYLIPGCAMCNKGVAINPDGIVIPCHVFLDRTEDMDKYKIYDLSTKYINPDIESLYNLCGSEYIMKGNDKLCGDCNSVIECVKCKAIQLLNGDISHASKFTCDVNTLRKQILLETVGDKFKPFTQTELEDFLNDLNQLKTYYKENPSEELLDTIFKMKKIYDERVWEKL